MGFLLVLLVASLLAVASTGLEQRHASAAASSLGVRVALLADPGSPSKKQEKGFRCVRDSLKAAGVADINKASTIELNLAIAGCGGRHKGAAPAEPAPAVDDPRNQVLCMEAALKSKGIASPDNATAAQIKVAAGGCSGDQAAAFAVAPVVKTTQQLCVEAALKKDGDATPDKATAGQIRAAVEGCNGGKKNNNTIDTFFTEHPKWEAKAAAQVALTRSMAVDPRTLPYMGSKYLSEMAADKKFSEPPEAVEGFVPSKMEETKKGAGDADTGDGWAYNNGFNINSVRWWWGGAVGGGAIGGGRRRVCLFDAV